MLHMATEQLPFPQCVKTLAALKEMPILYPVTELGLFGIGYHTPNYKFTLKAIPTMTYLMSKVI